MGVSAFHSAGLALFGPLLRELDGRPRVSLADADVAQDAFAGLTADHDLVIAHRLAHDPPLAARTPGRDRAVRRAPRHRAARRPPLARQAGIRPEQLRGEHWISTHEGFPLTGVLDHLGAVIGEAPRIDHRINEFSVAAHIVRAGAAVAVMPRTTAAALAVDGLVLRPVVGASLAPPRRRAGPSGLPRPPRRCARSCRRSEEWPGSPRSARERDAPRLPRSGWSGTPDGAPARTATDPVARPHDAMKETR
ncbi:LysR family transcriptional regulator substrate-binding protein [Rathayibacter oskolensis]|uniref:LysR family transcriptional regulator substrate-binding protein n=1 Tax=Rathayibacter oskolensis TaxID=1891671 RepID=UPI00265D6B4B|nr:LysR family transcriptional regulator substrate-binding protein [Rathayibacter oskolensis]WKK71335.1 LysR family transcriptional regulator substrate-binding protein [Rathayibacter oskolensis]